MLAALTMNSESPVRLSKDPGSTPKAQEEMMSMENLPKMLFISKGFPENNHDQVMKRQINKICSLAPNECPNGNYTFIAFKWPICMEQEALPLSAASLNLDTSLLEISSIRYFMCLSLPDVKMGVNADLHKKECTALITSHVYMYNEKRGCPYLTSFQASPGIELICFCQSLSVWVSVPKILRVVGP